MSMVNIKIETIQNGSGFGEQMHQMVIETIVIRMSNTIEFLDTLAMIPNSYDQLLGYFPIKTAFLNGNLLEDMYMTQLEGFVTSKNGDKVCKLQ